MRAVNPVIICHILEMRDKCRIQSARFLVYKYTIQMKIKSSSSNCSRRHRKMCEGGSKYVCISVAHTF